MALGAMRSDSAAFLIEPRAVTSRKYLMAVDSIMPFRPLAAFEVRLKSVRCSAHRSNYQMGRFEFQRLLLEFGICNHSHITKTPIWRENLMMMARFLRSYARLPGMLLVAAGLALSASATS